jgi:hypothetical protein
VRDDRQMRPDVHLDPDGLRRAAALAAEVVAALRPAVECDPPAPAMWARIPGGPALDAEHDRIRTAARRAAEELAELRAVLLAVAEGTEAAEHETRLLLRSLDDR